MQPIDKTEAKLLALEVLRGLTSDIESDEITIQEWSIESGIPLTEYRFKTFPTPKNARVDETLDILNSTRLSPEDAAHLKWVYALMVEVHGENPYADYLIKMRKILGIPDPEPVYEWQWKLGVWLPNSGSEWQSFTDFLTDEEAEHYRTSKLTMVSRFEKDESTKQERVR